MDKIVEKNLIKIAENVPKVYNAGYDSGYNKATEENSVYYRMTAWSSIFRGSVLPENVVLRAKELSSADQRFSYCFNNATGAKYIKLICDNPNGMLSMTSAFAVGSVPATLEVVDLTEFYRTISSLHNTFKKQSKLKTILGALDLNNCTIAYSAFDNCKALEDIEFMPNTINISITSFPQSSKLTKASLTSIINGLNADVTGQTLTLSKTAVNNAFTDAEWEALVATKTNWTISLI